MNGDWIRTNGCLRRHEGSDVGQCLDGHPESEASTTRRRLLGAVGTGALLGLAGCLGTETPDPVTLTDSDACDVCRMIIPHHPGPSAEVFYRNKDPSDHENPARFDSTWEAFQYDFERRDRGWTRSAFYVTDYSAVDYEVLTDGGRPLISTHPEASAFVLASDVTFVVASSVEGAMGRDLIGFGDEADARMFRDDYGGELAAFGEVTRSMIAELSGT
ncbi:nitrous oxide reductase accessory protein NosL [Halorhabdus rudnickae]|uniref:nitrous oxide reductase accessory protein NosL n=1 Tax=Halorhabdus rudnickae TaxID=1775544 RepID=UPI001083811C|nr:nitrous oxide reductase accessory protein NosL [Halorhabdus rudnickae]